MSKYNLAKVIATCLIIGISMQMCSSSAIPIWEFLTRNEKMSYLYSTFAQLVSVHCKATAATSTLPVNQCKHNLLSYGYEKLQTFSNEQLDALDPYQRGAAELIWSSIMREHHDNAVLITTRKPLPTPPATSIIILTHQNPIKAPTGTTTTTTNSNVNDDDGKVLETAAAAEEYEKNPIFEMANENKHQFAMDMDIAYGYPGKPAMNPAQVEIFDVAPAKVEQETKEQKTQQQQQPNTETYLTGPHVVRVRIDGRPVEEDQYKPLPQDDDLEAFQINTAALLPPTPPPAASTASQQIIHAAAGRPTKHRKIAMISALKQQYLTTLALQQQLLPPIEQPVQELQPPLERIRRTFPAMAEFEGGYYAA